MAKKRKGKSNYDKKQEQENELKDALMKSVDAEESKAATAAAGDHGDFENEDPIDVLKRWWNKYGINIALVVMLAVAAYFGLQMYNNSQRSSKDAAWGEFSSALTPNKLGEVAQDTSIPAIRNWAKFYGAVERLRRVDQYDEGNNTITSNEAADQDIKAAQQLINDFMAETPDTLKTGVPNDNKLNAYFNLGKAYENLNDFDKAGEQYKAGMTIIDAWVTSEKIEASEHTFSHKYEILNNAYEDLTVLRQQIVFPDLPEIATTQPVTTQPAATQPAATQPAE